MDSKIVTLSYVVTEEGLAMDVISKIGAGFLRGAQRPHIYLDQEQQGYVPIEVSLDDDVSSHCTPGTVRGQISMHKRESFFIDDDGL